MDKIKELRAKAQELVDKMRALLDLADTESRDLTPEETTQYAALEAEADKLDRDIDRLVKLEERAGKAAEAGDKPYKVTFKRGLKDTPKEFRDLTDFLHSVVLRRDDPRLSDCYVEFETRDQSMGVGTEGGFKVPEQFQPQLLQVTPQEMIFSPAAITEIPAGDPPDAKFTWPVLDQTAAQNIYGGVVMYKVAEAGTLQKSSIALKELSLEPQGIGGYVRATNKLLTNWAAAGTLLANQLRLALAGYKDTQFYSGNGVAGPLGILNSPARIDVDRATASTVAIADLRNMLARMKFGGSPVWIASQTVLPQLMQLAGGNSENIFVINAADPVPMRLFGYPIIFSDRSVALGTKGDIIFVDRKYYWAKNGSGPFVAASEHVDFLSNQTVIKITQNIDGKPWLSAPLPLEGSTSNTVSPFVVLN